MISTHRIGLFVALALAAACGGNSEPDNTTTQSNIVDGRGGGDSGSPADGGAASGEGGTDGAPGQCGFAILCAPGTQQMTPMRMAARTHAGRSRVPPSCRRARQVESRPTQTVTAAPTAASPSIAHRPSCAKPASVPSIRTVTDARTRVKTRCALPSCRRARQVRCRSTRTATAAPTAASEQDGRGLPQP